MKKIAIAVLLIFQCVALGAAPLRIGTTYSPKQSEYLGMEWKETYLRILDLGFDIIRLGAYWDAIEREKDVYDFATLDWQIAQARKRNIPVVLTVGMKAPRWPEYFIPGWLLRETRLPYGGDVSRDAFLRERTLKFIKTVVTRYRNDPIIHYWQVENEPMTRIGKRSWYIGKAFLVQEIRTVRDLDKQNRPVILTVPTYPNKAHRFYMRLTNRYNSVKESAEISDIIGLNIYPVVGHKLWWNDIYLWSTRKEREIYFSRIVNFIKGKNKKVWVVELQAEPWEPGHLVYKEEQVPPTGVPEEVKNTLDEITALGIDTVLLWGAEYWHFRERQHRDTSWKQTVTDILNKNQTTH